MKSESVVCTRKPGSHLHAPWREVKKAIDEMAADLKKQLADEVTDSARALAVTTQVRWYTKPFKRFQLCWLGNFGCASVFATFQWKGALLTETR